MSEKVEIKGEPLLLQYAPKYPGVQLLPFQVIQSKVLASLGMNTPENDLITKQSPPLTISASLHCIMHLDGPQMNHRSGICQ